jgi:predicted ATPase/MoxR-like ATPase
MLAGAQPGRRLPPVLIQGETGTGKGLLARALHHAGPRAAGPFVALNCGAIPETLAESEFFGFARGAHSEARHPKVGLFQAADQGTMFLDEVGLLSEGHQARLLKVVEDCQVVPVGSTRPVPVDIWLISATNADLWADIRDHRFRRDLYERLAVITFTLPPLRERRNDIIPLAERFLARSCVEYGLRPKSLTADAERRLLDYSWPGNVRELSNVIERAALLVEVDTIPAARLELASAPSLVSQSPLLVMHGRESRERLLETLEEQKGNITKTAARLGVTRKTLREWMKRKGLYPSPGSGNRFASFQGTDREARGQPTTADSTEENRSSKSVEEIPAQQLPPALPDLHRIALGSANIHWERRWITVLRVNLAPEDESVPRDPTRLLEIAGDKVQTFGGRVIELGRAGLQAAFGLDPLEDAAQRAAYAVLAIQRAGARAREQSTPALVSRIALHAGSFLVGRMGTLAQIDQDAKQGASALLATLVAAAPPDSAVVSRTVLPFLRRRFELSGPVAVGDGVEAHLLLNRADRPAFDAQMSPFVGRESELGLLENRYSLAAQGFGQIVGIVGDPGVGKSRLVWEFLNRGAKDRGLVLETVALALGRPTPYLAIIDLLRSCFGVETGETDAAIRDKVVQHLADLDPSLVDLLPAFLALFDVPSEDRVWDGLDPVQRRRRTFDSIKRLMFRESERQPLVLVFEDAHWADSETQALLETVADILPVARVLILAAFRPEYEHGWGSRTFYTQVRVDPLRGEGVHQFLCDLLGEHPSLDSLRARLVERTGGNPFFLEETIRRLAETAVLAGERGAYRLARPVMSIAVPDTVQEVLAARMARLAQPAYEVLLSAAVVGRRVRHDVLAAVSGLSAETLDRGLELLQTREFLSETSLAEDREYIFRHALTQEVAYTSLPDEQRRALHARIAEALETHSPELTDTQPELFAQHYAEAGLVEKSVHYWGKAGRRSVARSAMAEAVAQRQKGLEQLALLPDTVERKRQELEFWSALGAALIVVKGNILPETGHACARARELWEQLGSPSEFLHIPYAQARYHALRGEPDLARGLGEDLLRISLERNDSAGLVLGHMSSGRDLMLVGSFASARFHLESVQALYDPIAHRSLGHETGIFPNVNAEAYLGLVLFILGFPDQGSARSSGAIAEARALAHAPSLALTLGIGTIMLSLAGDSAALKERADQLVAVATEQGFPIWRGHGTMHQGWLNVENGQVAAGISLLRDGSDARRADGEGMWLPHYLALLARARETAAQNQEALGIFDETLQLVEKTRVRWLAAELHRHKGDMLLREGQSDAAQAAYITALAIAVEQGARFWELRAATSLARLRCQQDRRAEAHDILAPVYDWFTEGFATPDLKNAKALLDSIC